MSYICHIENREERSKAHFIMVGHGTKRERESIIIFMKERETQLHDYIQLKDY